MVYIIKDRGTGESSFAKDVKIDGEFIRTSDGNIHHGRNVDVRKSSDCFVATASGADHETLTILRTYRDQNLKKSRVGQIFVAGYYMLGPFLAATIRDRPRLRRAVKAVIVDPAANIARAKCSSRE